MFESRHGTPCPGPFPPRNLEGPARDGEVHRVTRDVTSAPHHGRSEVPLSSTPFAELTLPVLS